MTEFQIIEYKSSWRDEYIKWISGFANAQGGTLVLGKDDRGKTMSVLHTAVPLRFSTTANRG